MKFGVDGVGTLDVPHAREHAGIAAEGRAHGMPAWQPQLTPDQIWKLVTYVKLLRTRNEPNPPTSQ